MADSRGQRVDPCGRQKSPGPLQAREAAAGSRRRQTAGRPALEHRAESGLARWASWEAAERALVSPARGWCTARYIHAGSLRGSASTGVINQEITFAN